MKKIKFVKINDEYDVQLMRGSSPGPPVLAAVSIHKQVPSETRPI